MMEQNKKFKNRMQLIVDAVQGSSANPWATKVSINLAKKLKIKNPIISNEDLDKIKYIRHPDFKASSVKAIYKLSKGHNGLEEALEKLVDEVEKKVDNNHNIIR